MNTAEWQVPRVLTVLDLLLQWSRRVNTAECLGFRASSNSQLLASMEPPCEHGGVISKAIETAIGSTASMEPPCEHGGVYIESGLWPMECVELQWSRRVNTAECPGTLPAA